MGRRPKSTNAAASPAGAAGIDYRSAVADKKLVPNPADDQWALESVMAETNGGGSVEKVPGFDIFRAVTSGFESRRLTGPTTLLARPDGGFFSQGAGAPASSLSVAKPESVMGVDSRVMVTDTSTVPWRCICHLEVEYESGPVGFGTGFIIGPKTIITAAHVLIDPAKKIKRKARRVRVIPGRNGGTAPYGFFVVDFGDCKVAQGWLPRGSDDAAAAAFDYAMVPIPAEEEIKNKTLADRLGYFGLKCFADTDAEKKADMLFVNNAGYPYEADKPYGTLWYNAGRIREILPKFIEYMVDTEGGQSGSPIYYYDEEKAQRYVVAIHTTGDFVNRGLRITRDVFTQIKSWASR